MIRMKQSDGAEGFDVITMGRVGIDLYPEQSGVTLSQVERFRRFLGGSPTNVAVAAARLGHSSAVITKVGTEGFGDFVHRALRGYGVDDRFVTEDPVLKTPIVFCELFPPDNFPILFYRDPLAPDLNISTNDLDFRAICDASVFWTSGTGLSKEPSRSATLTALVERGRKHHTVHDLDFRSQFWSSRDEARACNRKALEFATVAVGNREEVAVVVGDAAPQEQATRLLDLGLSLAFVKLGTDGVLVATRDSMMHIPPTPVETVNGLGAGDAFGGAVCHGLLLGWKPERIGPFASAAGAYVAGQLACADAMPSEGQVIELMSRNSKVGLRTSAA